MKHTLSTKREKAKSLVMKIAIAFGISLLFALLAIIPPLGYSGKAQVKVLERHWTGYWLFDANFSATFNPFVYPLSWLSGYGNPSGAFLFISAPTYVGGEFKYPAWRSPADLEDEVMIKITLKEIPLNILFNFGVFLVVELTRLRVLYFCILGGVLGFPIGGSIGAVTGFFVGALLGVYVIPRIIKSAYRTRIKDPLLTEESGSHEVQS